MISEETKGKLEAVRNQLAEFNLGRCVTLDDTVRLLIRVWQAAQDPIAAQDMADRAVERAK